MLKGGNDSKRNSKLSNFLNTDIGIEDKKAPLKPGDTYDVVYEPMDPEDERREAIARKKYIVNKLFE